MADNEEKVTPETEEPKAEEKPAEVKEPEVATKKKGLSKGALIGIIAGAVVVVLAAAVFVTSFIFSSAAVDAYNSKDYKTAYEKITFPLASLTSNSTTVGQIKYDYVVKTLAKKGKYFEGAKILETLEGVVSEEKLNDAYAIQGFDLCKVGNIATLGQWEQDGDNLNGEEALQWIVLDVKQTKNGTRALIMTKDVIGGVEKWSKDETKVAYSTSELCGWCESDFYLSLIQTSELVKKNVPKIKVTTETVEGCVECEDVAEVHAFVLSYQEAQKYFAEGSELAKYVTTDETKATAKAKYEGVSANGFWLRNAGESEGFVCAYSKGSLTTGCPTYSSIGLRPCMWVTIG